MYADAIINFFAVFLLSLLLGLKQALHLAFYYEIRSYILNVIRFVFQISTYHCFETESEKVLCKHALRTFFTFSS